MNFLNAEEDENKDNGGGDTDKEKEKGKRFYFKRGGGESGPNGANSNDREVDEDAGDIEQGKWKDKDAALYNGPLRILDPMRTDVVKAQLNRQNRLERLAALNVPEMHYIGQITSGRRISSDPSEGIICRWKVDHGKCWEHLGGIYLGCMLKTF